MTRPVMPALNHLLPETLVRRFRIRVMGSDSCVIQLPSLLTQYHDYVLTHYRHPESDLHLTTCDMCLGHGKIIGLSDGRPVRCPKCFGASNPRRRPPAGPQLKYWSENSKPTGGMKPQEGCAGPSVPCGNESSTSSGPCGNGSSSRRPPWTHTVHTAPVSTSTPSSPKEAQREAPTNDSRRRAAPAVTAARSADAAGTHTTRRRL